MKSYLMNIIGAVLICVFTDIVLPDKWSKYIKIITGLIIITAIASPLENKLNLDFSEHIDQAQKFQSNGEEYTALLIKEELENTIKTDIEQRILDEFDKEIECNVSVGLNSENKISGILRVNLIGDVNSKMLSRIEEIYAPKEVLANGY